MFLPRADCLARKALSYTQGAAYWELQPSLCEPDCARPHGLRHLGFYLLHDPARLGRFLGLRARRWHLLLHRAPAHDLGSDF